MVTLCTTCTMFFFFNYDEAACPLGVIYIMLPTHSNQSLESHANCTMFLSGSFLWKVTTCAKVTFFLIFNAAIHEFPEDLFTNRQRTQGAVLLHIFAVGELCVRMSINVKPCSPVDLVIQYEWCLSENFMTIINTLSALCIIYDWLPLGSQC